MEEQTNGNFRIYLVSGDGKQAEIGRFAPEEEKRAFEVWEALADKLLGWEPTDGKTKALGVVIETDKMVIAKRFVIVRGGH
ncbi:hypothetical protein HYR54_14940 [Candidatus Acetothermia bacterium]|nr:hypothetical protein [Candidatus Acetothermia bacterium]